MAALVAAATVIQGRFGDVPAVAHTSPVALRMGETAVYDSSAGQLSFAVIGHVLFPRADFERVAAIAINVSEETGDRRWTLYVDPHDGTLLGTRLHCGHLHDGACEKDVYEWALRGAPAIFGSAVRLGTSTAPDAACPLCATPVEVQLRHDASGMIVGDVEGEYAHPVEWRMPRGRFVATSDSIFPTEVMLRTATGEELRYTRVEHSAGGPALKPPPPAPAFKDALLAAAPWSDARPPEGRPPDGQPTFAAAREGTGGPVPAERCYAFFYAYSVGHLQLDPGVRIEQPRHQLKEECVAGGQAQAWAFHRETNRLPSGHETDLGWTRAVADPLFPGAVCATPWAPVWDLVALAREETGWPFTGFVAWETRCGKPMLQISPPAPKQEQAGASVFFAPYFALNATTGHIQAASRFVEDAPLETPYGTST